MMKRQNTNANNKLKAALLECLDDEYGSVPCDTEIKNIYTPSKELEGFVMGLKPNRAENVYLFKRLSKAAAAAVILIFAFLGFNAIRNVDNSNVNYETAQDQRADDSEMLAQDSVMESSAYDSAMEVSEEAAGNDEEGVEEEAGSLIAWNLVNIDEDMAVFDIFNNTEELISVSNILKVEKVENDRNVQCFINSTVKEYNVEPIAEMREEVRLSDIGINENGTYIIYRNVNEIEYSIELIIENE